MSKQITFEKALEILDIKINGLLTDIRQREMEGTSVEWEDKVDRESIEVFEMAKEAILFQRATKEFFAQAKRMEDEIWES